MIQFTLNTTNDPDILELRASAVDGDTAAKPPFIVRHDELTITLLALLRAAQMEAM